MATYYEDYAWGQESAPQPKPRWRPEVPRNEEGSFEVAPLGLSSAAKTILGVVGFVVFFMCEYYGVTSAETGERWRVEREIRRSLASAPLHEVELEQAVQAGIGLAGILMCLGVFLTLRYLYL